MKDTLFAYILIHVKHYQSLIMKNLDI